MESLYLHFVLFGCTSEICSFGFSNSLFSMIVLNLVSLIKSFLWENSYSFTLMVDLAAAFCGLPFPIFFFTSTK